MLSTIYKELKGSFDDIQTQIETFRKDFENNWKWINKQWIIFSILQNIDFQKFLIYKLNKTDYWFFLKVFEDDFVVEITQLWHSLYPYYRRINKIKNFLRYDQRQLLMKKNPNLELLSNKVNALYVVYLLYVNLDFLREKMIITNLLINKMSQFLKRTEPNIDKINFYNLINLLQILYKKNIINSNVINNFDIEKKEWELFHQSWFCDNQNVIYQFHCNPELYENDFNIYFKENRIKLQEKWLQWQWSAQAINDLKMLITYNNLKKSYENLIKLSFFELFLIKLFYNFDLKNLWWDNLQYIIPIYLLHFSNSYKEFTKIKYIFSWNFQIKYLLYLLVSIIIIAFWSVYMLISWIIIIFSNRIWSFLSNITSTNVNYSIPIKFIWIVMIIYSLSNNRFGDYYNYLMNWNYYTDIVNQWTIITDYKQWRNIPIIGNKNSSTPNSNNIIKVQIDNIGELLWTNQDERYYYIGENEKISDVVNSYIPISIKWEDRKLLVKKVTNDYIDLNKDYILWVYKISNNITNEELNNKVWHKVKIDILMINQIIEQYK